MKQNIYGIEQEYLILAEQITEQGGEITAEQEQALALNKETLEVKAVKYGYIIKTVEDDILAIDREIKRLEELKKPKVNLIAKLENTVSQAMDLYGISEIKLQNLKIYFHPSTSADITDEKSIPAKYKKREVVIKIDKKAILADLRAEKKVKGAELKKNKTIKFK